jgi:hypothetical protein
MTGQGASDPPSDALRARLAAIDPTRPGGPAFRADPAPTETEERIMATTSHEEATAGESGPPVPSGSRRTAWLAAAAAVLVVAAGVTGVLALRDAGPQESTQDSVALRLPATDGISGSCVQFDVAILRDMPVALAGTVTALGDDSVTLQVDRWYRADAQLREAELVTIAVPDENSSAALDGVDFRDGESYLLTATDGMVNGCGFSGPADAQLEAAYAEAFGG